MENTDIQQKNASVTPEVPAHVRNTLFAFIILTIVGATAFFYTFITSNRQREELQGRIAATAAAAIAPSIMRSDTQVLQEVVVAIARTGNFSLVIAADPNGKVIASTDRRFDNQALDDLTRASVTPKPYLAFRRTRYDMIVEYQGNSVGFLRLEIGKNDS
jgi:hypothetical protein